MKVTKKQKNLLKAIALGDGWIDKNGQLSVFHSEKQKDYVEYKFNLLKSLCTTSEIIKRISNDTVQYGFRIKVIPYTKLLRRILYKEGIKTISLKYLNSFTKLELAIWWMDDGSCSTKYNKATKNIKGTVSTLSTQMSKEQNQIIIDYFKNTFDISFGQRKMKNHYSLICGTKEGRKLQKLLIDYVIPSLQYKLSN